MIKINLHHQYNSHKKKSALNITNENYNNLTDSVNSMSLKFDSFSTHLQKLLS